jgi:dihydrofolate synthase/folylpolyglutamate synthase
MTTARSLAEWLDYIERQHPKSIELGLDRVREVAQRIGLQRPAKKVITVGGTNGKGSTVAFIEAVARAAGWRVGAFTSPHLLEYNERVRIDGVDVTDATLVEAFEVVEAAARGDAVSPSPLGRRVGVRIRRKRGDQRVPEPASGPSDHLLPQGEGKAVALTYFEYGTLAALWLFERSKLDLAILEVGLGGRLDAVNLIDADVAVITTVDIDHQDWLGSERETIGLEKVGIARAGKPLVLGEDDPPSSVLGRAYAIGASAIRAGCDFFFDPVDGEHWRWREIRYALDLPMPQLVAPAQMRNAATAVAALRALRKPIPRKAYAQGVADARIAGRLQRFERNGVEVMVDVAHNPQAARELAAWLRQAPISGRTFAVFAALGDKDIVGVVAALAGGIDRWFIAGLEQAGPRGLDATAFAQRLAGGAAGSGEKFTNVDEALTAAEDQTQSGDRIVVFGSFHTAAAALRLLQAGR